jgi:hypothetical protein
LSDQEKPDIFIEEFCRAERWKTEHHTDEEGITYSRKRQWIKEFKSEPSRAKVIKSGPKTEVYIYEKPVFLKAKDSSKWTFRTGRKKKDEQAADYDRHDENRNLSSRKAKFRLMRLVAENFSGENSKFLTLTFSDNETSYNKVSKETWNFNFHRKIINISKSYVDSEGKKRSRSKEEKFDYKNIEHTNKAFKTFIQRMRLEYGDFKYVAVPEFQDANGRGAVHYHMIADLPYIKIKKLSEELWGWGWVLITDIKHVDNVGVYITKYMTQDINDFRLEGKKAYMPSKNLDKPEEKHSYDAYAEISKMRWEGKIPIYEDEYGHEEDYVGRIKFYEYHDRVNTQLQFKNRQNRITKNRKIKAHLNKSPNEPTRANGNLIDN